VDITRQQREQQNAEDFRQKFMILHQAAIGVLLCRTREPFRACETFRNFAFAENKLEYKLWTVTTGWQSYERNAPDKEPTFDGNKEPAQALAAVNGINGANGFGDGIYVMMYPHHWVGKVPGIMQMLKEYARLFSETKQRVVLICPPGFTLPQELEDDITILDFDTPSFAEVGSIFDRMIGVNIEDEKKRPIFTEEDKRRLIGLGGGMTAHEFENTLSRALITNRTKLPNVPVDDFAKVITEVKTEVVKRSEVLEMMDAENMGNVGGLDNLKEWVTKRKPAFSEEAKQYGIDAPKGIALIGPPGTGKSLAAKAISSVLGLPLIRFDVGRVFNSLVGASEARVRAALKMVDSMAPAVLMIDEVDKAFQSNSGGGDSGVSQRVLGAILTWMQETKAPIFLVVTANRVNNLPSEFLRRGRLDDVFSVSVPGEDERREIFKIHLRKRGHEADLPDLDIAVERSNGYVPAELEAAVKDALIESFSSEQPLTGQLVAEMLGNMKPLSEAFKEDFQVMQSWAEANARPANRSGGAAFSQATSRPGRMRPPIGGKRTVNLDG
jgi:hypothetical protein